MLPSLEQFDIALLQETVWQRDILSLRDRCLATLAVAITRNEKLLLEQQVILGLKHKITPIEINGIITHLSFYSGWGRALEASETVISIFNQLKIDTNFMINNEVDHYALDEQFENARAAAVEKTIGSQAFPNLVKDTTQVLFHDLWLRADLEPRDRSLITVSALIASGKTEQISFHLNKALDNGLSQEAASELISHLAYYVGWPSAMSAVPVIKNVFSSR